MENGELFKCHARNASQELTTSKLWIPVKAPFSHEQHTFGRNDGPRYIITRSTYICDEVRDIRMCAIEVTRHIAMRQREHCAQRVQREQHRDGDQWCVCVCFSLSRTAQSQAEKILFGSVVTVKRPVRSERNERAHQNLPSAQELNL